MDEPKPNYKVSTTRAVSIEGRTWVIHLELDIRCPPSALLSTHLVDVRVRATEQSPEAKVLSTRRDRLIRDLPEGI